MMNEKFEWTNSNISEFLNGVKTGRILSASCGHTEDRDGPLTSFSFPDYFCEIHVHWKDSQREEMAKAHIKDLRIKDRVKAAVDTYTIAMLRHFSGLDDKQKISKSEKENENKLNSIQNIENLFINLGYEKLIISNSVFSEAYFLKKTLTRGNIAFLLCLYSRDDNIKDLIKKARVWSKSKLKANKFTNGVSLNIVFIHKGELTSMDIKGLTDKTGLHHSLLRSLTIINYLNKEIYQASFGTGFMFNATNILSKTIASLKILDLKKH